jgi:hypothetical protein
MFIPSESNGGETVASCDNWGFYASNPVVFVGGNYGQFGDRGLFFVNNVSVTHALASFGSRLQELP